MNQEIYLSTEPRGGGYVRYDGMMNAYSPTIKKSTLITTTTPQVKQIIFNDPATIVYWQDGTKTVVKTMHGDIFNEEYGVAMAYIKKIYGSSTGFKKMVAKYKPVKVVKEKSKNKVNNDSDKNANNRKRKIGEEVVIKKDLVRGYLSDGSYVSNEMARHAGKKATITHYLDNSSDFYKLDIDEERWVWLEAMLEPRN